MRTRGCRGTIALTSTVTFLLITMLPAVAPGFSAHAARPPAPSPAPSIKPLRGDFTGDCVVNAADLAGVLARVGGSDPRADFNGDNAITQIDVDIVRASWGNTCATRLLGDVNGDGVVTVVDLTRLLTDWRTRRPQSDINQDGTVGAADLAILQANWGRTLARRLLGDHTGDDVVNADDLAVALAGRPDQSARARSGSRSVGCDIGHRSARRHRWQQSRGPKRPGLAARSVQHELGPGRPQRRSGRRR